MASAVRDRYDSIVVGGGPAGLSAALTLGRACRSVLLVDAGEGRNAPADAVHGFLGHDGTPPSELRRLGRAQLAPYQVDLHDGRVTGAKKLARGFEVALDGSTVTCRTLILATGIADRIPQIAGGSEWWGRGIVLCPYCHGWEIRERPWAFLAPPEELIERATMLLGWTKRLTYLTNGEGGLTLELATWLSKRQIGIRKTPLAAFEGEGERFIGVRFENGDRLECAAVFVSGKFAQTNSLAESLGCELVSEGHAAGTVRTEANGVTSVEGLFIAGDAASYGAMGVASAASEGMMAAVFANMAMLKADAA